MSTLKVDTIQGKTTAGTVAMPSGHVIQVQYTTTTSSITTTSGSLAASGHIVAITPKFSNSKILINITGGEQTYSGGGIITGTVHIYRQLTGGSYADLSGQVCEQSMGGDDDSDYGHTLACEFIDTTHNTTNAINYQPYIKTNSGTYFYNYTPTALTLRVMEIKQ
tara:strand:+ start:2189 stop:2683 length:495 start_codon:yes stop_codon:yes gene_type:complete